MRGVAFRSAVALCLVAALTTGCASIIHGTKQDVRVLSSPSGAVVRVNLNNMATTTPGVVTLDRKETGYVLTFEKEGYKPVEVSIRRTVDGWLFGNILFGGLIGIIIDFVSGSAYRLTPDEVQVALASRNASLKRGRKDGDILVFVDLEELPREIRDRILQRNQGKAA